MTSGHGKKKDTNNIADAELKAAQAELESAITDAEIKTAQARVSKAKKNLK